MTFINMKRGLVIVLFFVFLIALSYLGQFSGAYSYNGYPSGRYFPVRSDEENTKIEIVANKIDVNGRPVIEAGKKLYFTIKVGKDGIRREVGLRNAVSSLKVDAIRDICNNAFCVDRAQCIGGPKCFEDRSGSFFIPTNRKPGLYVVTACTGNLDMNKCEGNEITSHVFSVIAPSQNVNSAMFYRGQMNYNQ